MTVLRYVVNWSCVLSEKETNLPFTGNIARSLLKEPKVYLWDWSIVENIGARNENFAAMHLLKFVHHLTDSGFGDFGLNYIRDKNKREVDFVVLKNKQPWFLVEVKSGEASLTDALVYFHKRTKVKHSFLASVNLPNITADCFKSNDPVVVPMSTLLSQLV